MFYGMCRNVILIPRLGSIDEVHRRSCKFSVKRTWFRWSRKSRIYMYKKGNESFTTENGDYLVIMMILNISCRKIYNGLSLRQRGFIYSRCVRPVLLYSCETWSLTTNLKLRLQSTERRMVRMMCGVRLVDRLPSEELRRRLGIQPDVIECLKTSILRWFGHVVRREDTHPIKAAHNFSVTGKKPSGRPKKTWDNAVREILKARWLSEVDALNRVFRRSRTQGRPANLSQLGQGGNRWWWWKNIQLDSRQSEDSRNKKIFEKRQMFQKATQNWNKPAPAQVGAISKAQK